MNMSELQMQLLKKVEELTLSILEQEKTITPLTRALAEVKACLAVLEQTHH